MIYFLDYIDKYKQKVKTMTTISEIEHPNKSAVKIFTDKEWVIFQSAN